MLTNKSEPEFSSIQEKLHFDPSACGYYIFPSIKFNEEPNEIRAGDFLVLFRDYIPTTYYEPGILNYNWEADDWEIVLVTSPLKFFSVKAVESERVFTLEYYELSYIDSQGKHNCYKTSYSQPEVIDSYSKLYDDDVLEWHDVIYFYLMIEESDERLPTMLRNFSSLARD